MDGQMTGLNLKLGEVSARIKELRHIEGISKITMANLTGVSVEEYEACENGSHDLSFAFIYRCALAFKVNVTDIIEGSSPKLKSYTVTKRGMGTEIQKAHGMVYYGLASEFKDRVSEPLYVKCKYDEDCSRYPMCGKTCGLSLEELLWRKNQQIRDLKHDMLTVKTHQLLSIEKSLYAARTILSKIDDYIPTCPYGYMDCVSDPAYIRKYLPLNHRTEKDVLLHMDVLHRIQ